MKRRSWSGPLAPDVDEWDRWLISIGKPRETRRLYVGVPRRAAAAGALESRYLLAQWLAQPQWSKSTRHAYGSALRAYLTWARARGWRLPHPRHVGRTAQPQGLPKPLTPGELVALQSVPDASPRTITWIRLSLATGLRAGEIARLRAEDVDLVGARLTVRGKGDRSRVIPLHPDAVDILGRLPERGQLWPGVKPHNVTNCSARLFRRAGVPGGIHRCRHWHATELLERDVDIATIQRLLGHASIATTQVYLLVRPTREALAVSRLTIPLPRPAPPASAVA